MKDNKDSYFRLRLTNQEKEKLKEYAASRNISMSEAIRDLCWQIFNKTDKE